MCRPDKVGVETKEDLLFWSVKDNGDKDTIILTRASRPR